MCIARCWSTRDATAGWSRLRRYLFISSISLQYPHRASFLHLSCTCMLEKANYYPPQGAGSTNLSFRLVILSRASPVKSPVSPYSCIRLSQRQPRLRLLDAVLIKRRLRRSHGSNLVIPRPNRADPSPNADGPCRESTHNASRPERRERLNVQGVQPCSPRVNHSVHRVHEPSFFSHSAKSMSKRQSHRCRRPRSGFQSHCCPSVLTLMENPFIMLMTPWFSTEQTWLAK